MRAPPIVSVGELEEGEEAAADDEGRDAEPDADAETSRDGRVRARDVLVRDVFGDEADGGHRHADDEEGEDARERDDRDPDAVLRVTEGMDDERSELQEDEDLQGVQRPVRSDVLEQAAFVLDRGEAGSGDKKEHRGPAFKARGANPGESSR